jgi:hypothetical protein
MTGTDEVLTAVFREEAARLTATLVCDLGDFGAAEEVVSDALADRGSGSRPTASWAIRTHGRGGWRAAAPSIGCGVTPAMPKSRPDDRQGGRPGRAGRG